jgi:hypothetical protein
MDIELDGPPTIGCFFIIINIMTLGLLLLLCLNLFCVFG